MKKKSTVMAELSSIIACFFLIGLFLVKGAFAANIDNSGSEKEPYMIEPCVFKVPVILPASLESQRKKIEKSVFDAQRSVRDFAKANKWDNLLMTNIFDRVEIYDDKDEFNKRVLYLCGAEPATKIPESYAAVLERRVLVSVSPELFKKVNSKFVEDGFFEKVLAHEITHRLHVRIVADENAMGPIWFFEGFAVYGAGQMKNNMPVLSSEEIWNIVQDEKRGDYRKYNTVFRYFAKRIPLEKLIRMAADRNFIEHLKDICR